MADNPFNFIGGQAPFGRPTVPNLSTPDGQPILGGFTLDQGLDVAGDIWDWITGDSNGTTQTVEPSSNGRARPAASGVGCPITLAPTPTQRMTCAPGYVLVKHPTQGKVCMLKEAARSCGLWKAPRKPPIKASDMRCLSKATSVIRKMDRIAKMTNKITGKANLTRTRSKSR